MSAHNLVTLIKRTSLNVYEADIFNCSRQACNPPYLPERYRAILRSTPQSPKAPRARDGCLRSLSCSMGRVNIENGAFGGGPATS
jgi:hypothetical protein